MVYGPFYLLLEAALLAADSEPTRGLRSWLRPHATSVNCLFPTYYVSKLFTGTSLSSPAAGSPPAAAAAAAGTQACPAAARARRGRRPGAAPA